jgi:hypothetical protein
MWAVKASRKGEGERKASKTQQNATKFGKHTCRLLFSPVGYLGRVCIGCVCEENATEK